jgi:hypothetical protein
LHTLSVAWEADPQDRAPGNSSSHDCLCSTPVVPLCDQGVPRRQSPDCLRLRAAHGDLTGAALLPGQTSLGAALGATPGRQAGWGCGSILDLHATRAQPEHTQASDARRRFGSRDCRKQQNGCPMRLPLGSTPAILEDPSATGRLTAEAQPGWAGAPPVVRVGVSTSEDFSGQLVRRTPTTPCPHGHGAPGSRQLRRPLARGGLRCDSTSLPPR